MNPSYGEIWFANLEPTRGHEQTGIRPVLIISHDAYNHGPAGLVITLPITSKVRGIPYHVTIKPPEGGLKQESAILCDHIRSLAKERLTARWGTVSSSVLDEIHDRLRMLLNL